MTNSLLAVSGSTGRLGRALMKQAGSRDVRVVGWSRPDYDLDDADAAERMLAGETVGTVIHSAAWTDVDGCARDPDLAMRRNGEAAREMAAACAARRVRMVLISTNEVFDGERLDGLGYSEADARRPINPYGASKLGGEKGATAAFDEEGWPTGLLIVRTAWLYGPPGHDFPTKIVAAADRLPAEKALSVVDDEIGSPTYAPDLAVAILDLLTTELHGPVHLVNAGSASRLDAARLVLARLRPARNVTPISRIAFTRPSHPPAWAVLDTERAAAAGIRLRQWDQAMGEYAGTLEEGVTPQLA